MRFSSAAELLALLAVGVSSRSHFANALDFSTQKLVVIGQSTPPMNQNVWRTTTRGPSQRSRPLFPSEGEKDSVQYEQRSLSDFATRDSRLGFVRKVYSIFAAQMLCTIAVTGVIMNDRALQYTLLSNFQRLSIVSYIVSFGVISALVSSPKLRHTAPYNFVLLAVHTFLQSVNVGLFSSLFNPRMVCLGTFHTLATLAAITAYSFQPNAKYDLTPLGNMLLTSLVSVSIGTLLNIFFKMPLLDNIFSGFLAVIFATYMAYDVQKIVGGKHHKHQYGQREYILAAMNLYQDVINFFIQMMKILAASSKRNRRGGDGDRDR
jgi:FtsH-binding integral membrane protein